MKARIKKSAQRYAKKVIQQEVDAAVDRERDFWLNKSAVEQVDHVRDRETRKIGAIKIIPAEIETNQPQLPEEYIRKQLALELAACIIEHDLMIITKRPAPMVEPALEYRAECTVVVPEKGDDKREKGCTKNRTGGIDRTARRPSGVC